MRSNKPVPGFRRRLLYSTALLGGTLLLAAEAGAQLPDTNVANMTIATSGGPAPTFTPNGALTQLDITLNDPRTIITWGPNGHGFDVGTGNAVNFLNGVGGSTNLAVLNRDLTGAASMIDGSINSPSRIAVYLVNPNGILFGPGASVNVGALVAGSVDMTASSRSDFIDLTKTNPLVFAGAPSASGAVTWGGASIVSTGAGNGFGQIVLLGPQVNVNAGTLTTGLATAPDSDLAFVAGTDISISAPGSPLKITITKGTQLSAGVTVAPGVTATGRNVTVAVAAVDTYSTLLSINGTLKATTATATDRGIVLAAGSDPASADITIASSLDTAGTASIQVNGTLIADRTAAPAAGTADVEIRARNNVTGTGSVDAEDQVSITSATGNVNFTGSILAGNGITATANQALTLDDATSTTGNVVLTGNTVTLPTANIQAQAGNVTVNGPATVTGSTAVTVGGAGSTVAFSNTINGNGSLSTSSNGGTLFNANVGATTPLASLAVTGPATIQGNVSATGAVTFSGALSLAGAGLRKITGGSASFQAVSSIVAGATSLSVDTGGGAATFNSPIGAPNALSGLAVRAGSASFNGTNFVGTLAADVATGGISFTNGQALTIGTVDGLSGVKAGTGPVGIVTTGGVSSNLNVSGPVTATAGPVTLTSSGNLTGAGAILAGGAGNDATLSAAAGSINLGGTIGAGGDVSASAMTAVTLAGPVTSGVDIAINSGGTINTGDLAALDDIVLRSTGATATGAVTSGNGGAAVDVPPGAGDAITAAVSPGGDIDVAANGLVVGPVRANGANSDIRLTGGVGGIGSGAQDLDLRAGGNIVLTDAATGRDVALDAGGTISTGAISAHDDIAARSVGSSSFGALTSGAAAATDTPLLTGAADALLGVHLAGNDIDLGSGDGLATGQIDSADDATLAAVNLLTLGSPAIVADDLTLTAGQWGGSALSSVPGDDLTITDTAGGLVLPNALTVPGLLTVNVQNGGPLTVAAPLKSVNESIALTTAPGGDIALNANLTTGTAAGRTVTLVSGGMITQAAGTAITAHTLTGSAATSATLGSTANAIGNLGNFSAASLLLRNGAALSITGAVGAGGGIDIATTAGDLTLASGGSATTGAGALSLTGANNLAVAGAVASGSGPITLAASAGNLTVGSTGTVLSTSGATSLAAANNISLAGAVNSGSGPLAVTATAGSIGLGGALSTTAGMSLNAATTITQTAGTVSAATLTGSSAGATSLAASTNQIGTLGNFTANGFALTDGGGLIIAGNLAGGAGGASVATSGDLDLNGTVTAAGGISLSATGAGSDITLDGPVNTGSGTVSLNAGATIGQSGSGIISAGTLTGASGGDTSLGLTNQLTNLGAFTVGSTGPGGFLLRDANGLTVTGPVTVQALGTAGIVLETSGDLTVAAALSSAPAQGPISLIATGGNSDIQLGAPVNAGSGTVALTANGSGATIGQNNAGVITAGTLTGSSSGPTTLTAALNAVAGLGAFASTGFAFRNDPALVVTGPVNAGSGTLSLEVVADPVTISGNLTGQGVSVKAAGVAQAAASTINAGAGTILVDADDGAVNLAGALATTNGGANAVAIVDSAGAVLGNITTGAGGTVTLGGPSVNLLNGGVTQTAGTAIVAGTLKGNAGGAVTLANAGNQLDFLGAFTSNGFSLRDSAGGLTVNGQVDAGTGNLSLRVDGGNLVLADNLNAAGAVALDALAGSISQPGGRIAAGTLTGSSSGSTTLNSATNAVANLAAFTAGTDFSFVDGIALTVTGPVTATAGDLSILAPGIAFAGQTLTAGDDVTLDAQGGALAGGTVVAGDNLTGLGASVAVASASGVDIALRATAGALGAGTLTARDDIALRATGTITVNAASSGATIGSQGAIDNVGVADTLAGVLLGNDIDAVADSIAFAAAAANGASSDLNLTAQAGALTLGTGNAGATATLTKAGGAGELQVTNSLTSGTAAPAGNSTVSTSTNARLGTVDSRTGSVLVNALNGSVTGAPLGTPVNDGRPAPGFGGANLLAASAGRDVTVRAGGAHAQLGTVTAGRTARIEANELELLAAVSAPTVEIVNRGAGGATRLGNGLAAGAGLNLSEAEVNRIAAASLTVDSAARNVEIGNLAVSAAAGSARLNLFGTARFDVTGQFATAQASTARVVQIGGSAANSGEASVIRVAATPTAGGRLLAGNSQLQLRGQKIGVGQDSDFLAALGLIPGGSPASQSTVNADYIGNSGSRLYNPAQPYQNNTILTAHQLTVSYTDYALFQNTALPGLLPQGAVVGTLGVQQTLALNSSGPNAPNGFGLFGEVSGRQGVEAALLGPNFIILNGANPNNTRINGCLVGSGAGGCLISAFSTPPVTIFGDSQADILSAEGDLPITFDPVVGANNEALFSDLATSVCEPGPDNPDCPDEGKDPR